MAEQEILPCPNPECRGKCSLREQDDRCYGGIECHVACDNSKCFHRSPLAATRYKSPGCVDGRFNPRAEAIRLHNALPREEPWIEVAKAGLPEYEESRNATYDVWSTAGHWLDCLSLNGVFETQQGEQIPQATHYRIHRAPKEPR